MFIGLACSPSNHTCLIGVYVCPGVLTLHLKGFTYHFLPCAYLHGMHASPPTDTREATSDDLVAGTIRRRQKLKEQYPTISSPSQLATHYSRPRFTCFPSPSSYACIGAVFTCLGNQKQTYSISQLHVFTYAGRHRRRLTGETGYRRHRRRHHAPTPLHPPLHCARFGPCTPCVL